MKKVYELTITKGDCNGNPIDTKTLRFETEKEMQGVISFIDTQCVDETYTFDTDEYFFDTVEGAKKEIRKYLNYDEQIVFS